MSNKKIPDIDILYEDADIAAVNKPAGIMVHPDGRSEGPFLTDWIIKKFPKSANVGEPAHSVDADRLDRPGIVHRLDRETSGVLLIAKTKKGHACLKKQFKERTIKKKYLAFVWGEMDEEFGTIKRAIGRSGGDFRKWSAQRGARGEMRDAETYWTKVASFRVQVESGERELEGGKEKNMEVGEAGKMGKFTLIEAEPKTGRTHQIRVHFAAIQHPVVGDTLYAPKRPPALGFTRTALHSTSIEFVNCKGKSVKIVAPLPEDFERAEKKAGIKIKDK